MAVLFVPLLYLAWRQGLALIAAIIYTIGVTAFVWSLRGPLIERTIAQVLRRVGTAETLADLMDRSTTHHVICATEAQLGETVYFAPDAIRLRGHEPYAADLPAARAVRASAAFPLAFPPVFLLGIARSRPELGLMLSYLVLVDGGVRDNLGFGWFEDHARGLDELIVVSAAPNRSAERTLPIVPGFSELIAILRIAFLPYNTRERLKRNLVASYLYPPRQQRTKGIGAILHIEDSPFVLPVLLSYVDAPRGNTTSSNPSDEPTVSAQAPDYAGYNQAMRNEAQFFDYRRDQIALAHKLRESEGRNAEELLGRAKAALEYLESVEPKLQRVESSLNRVPTRRSLSSSADDAAYPAFIAWELRTRRSADLKTTFAAFARADAANLIIHGYCLACTNLHVALDWPLLDGLSAERLQALCGQPQNAPP
jgi:predicted acylesterase/phospholipase RssA